ncbi:MAG: MATE family efflux transporter [Victivallaceae bacterium]|nr:MATE family efflux transporter [Victivallaceae bacterium]
MKKYEIDMCHGALFGKIVLFALPLMATYILQLLFNAVDLVVIGHYAHYNAMAAVGATMNLNSLVLNIFIGLSIGTNVVVARLFGAKNMIDAKKAVHTSMAVALFGGLALMVVGLAVAKPLLVLMRTPEEILPLSCQYIWICFCAIPFIMLYNFGCAVLRAVGDTRRPLIYLIIAGIVNVLLNLFFVIVCHMSVCGVALATAASHGIAAALILRTLTVSRESYAVHWKELGFDGKIFREILKIGVPAGIQSSCFAVSNMIIQSSINSFGPLAIAGTTAVLGMEGIVYTGSFAFHQTAISFVAQNLGGRKYKRILKSLYCCFVCAVIASSLIGWGFFLGGRWLLAIFNPHPEVIAWGMLRMKILFTTYGLCGIMDVASGGLRGLGYSLTSTMVSLMGACVFRAWWAFWVFPSDPTMENLLLSYPISWILVAAVSSSLLFFCYRKLLHSHCRISTPWLGLRPGIPRGLRYLGGAK